MPQHSPPLATLIASRICHDLVSPLGAIINGLELLQLSGIQESPELDLIKTSAAHATARVRLFRLAFGQADTGQITRAQDISDILDAVYAEGRITLELHLTEDVPRPVAQMLLLTILCVEQALPYGGRLGVAYRDGRWQITATAEQLHPKCALWDAVSGRVAWPDIKPSQVQFLLLSQCLAAQSSRIEKSLSDTQLCISF